MRYILFLSALAYSLLSVAQSDLYVSPSGNDANPGSLSAPWQHVQYAIDQATPGNTIHLRQGTYNEEVEFNVSGTSTDPITLTNYQGEVVEIDGSGLSAYSIVTLFNQSHITLDGLIIQNNTTNGGNGLLIEGACANITVLNCEIRGIHFSSDPNAVVTPNTAAQPLLVFGTETSGAIQNLTVANCTIHDCRTGFSEGLAINGNVDSFFVLDNSVYNISNIGIDIIGHEGTCPDPALDQARNGVVSGNHVFDCVSPYATAAGIYIDGGKNIRIENNRIHNGQWGIEVGCENVGKSAESIVVRNNRIWANDGAGLSIGGFDYPNGSGKVELVSVHHNTLFGNDQGNNFDGELVLTYIEQGTITHNIFSATNTNGQMLYLDAAVPTLSTFGIDYNLWYLPSSIGLPEFEYGSNSYTGLSAFQVGTGHGGNSISADPLFFSASLPNPDLHINISSPAMNAGNASFVAGVGEYDMDLEVRVDGIVDIGADEYYPNTAIFTAETTSLFALFPNPTKSLLNIQAPEQFNTPFTLRVFDIAGKLLQQYGRSPRTLDLSFLPAGSYSIQIEYGSTIENHQLQITP